MDETTISQLNPAGMMNQAPRGGSKKKILIPVIIIIILLALIFGGVTIFRSKSETIPAPTPFPTEEPTAAPAESPTPQISPTPTKKTAAPTKKPVSDATSSASVNTKGLIVRVLNGSGITGRASDTADYLKGLGYAIGGTGNADTDTNEQTTISIKASKSDLLNTLKADLLVKYQIGTTSAALSSSESFDALVVVGKN